MGKLMAVQGLGARVATLARGGTLTATATMFEDICCKQ